MGSAALRFVRRNAARALRLADAWLWPSQLTGGGGAGTQRNRRRSQLDYCFLYRDPARSIGVSAGLLFPKCAVSFPQVRLSEPQKSRRAAGSLSRSDWASPFLRNGSVGTEGEVAAHQHLSFTAGSTPNDCRPRKRHVWGTRQSRWPPHADGFAV
jgi:hypothetical protein